MPRGINAYDEARLQNRNVADANAVNTVSPGIVTDGLVLHLDAGNRTSYPGNGTLWYDLSGNGITFSLSNITFTNDCGGGIVFQNGSIGSATGAFNFLFNGFAMSVWLKHTGTVSTARTQRYFSVESSPSEGPVLRHNASNNGSLHGYVFDSGNTFRSIDIPDQVVTNTYYNFVYTYDGGIFRLYKNAVEVGSLSLAITLPLPSLSAYLASSTEYFEGNMYIVNYYNRGLASTEIAQNFNATRARFGI